MKVINLYGGPGTGKSTTAAGLFYKLKSEGVKCELVTEVAKDMTYNKAYIPLSNQMLVFSKQFHKLFVLAQTEIEYAIVDSPLLLSNIYYSRHKTLPEREFKLLVKSVFDSFDNINIFLKRNIEEHPYQEYGRNQTLEQAEQIDEQIKEYLRQHQVAFTEVEVSSNTVDDILSFLKVK